MSLHQQEQDDVSLASFFNEKNGDHNEEACCESDVDDSDEEEPLPEENDPLGWRGDPNQTHSDWTIEIVVLNNVVNQRTTSDDEEAEMEKKLQKLEEEEEEDATNKGCTVSVGESVDDFDDSRSSSKEPPPRGEEETATTTAASSSSSSSVDIVETFRVHKYVLGYGPHKSSYFESLFQQKNKISEAKGPGGDCTTSRIELDELAAKAFPQLLDFVYSTDDKALNINTENATALHYLGQYFEIRRLRWLARNFWRQDISLANIDVYYEHAKRLGGKKILQAVTYFCSQNIQKIQPSSPIMQKSDPAFWIQVLEEQNIAHRQSHNKKNDKKDDKDILHMSSLIAQRCKKEDVDVKTFQELTGQLSMVSFDAAPMLSHLEDKLVDVGDESTTKKKNHHPNHRVLASSSTSFETTTNDDDHHPEEGLSILQRRCITSISQGWEKLKMSDQREFLTRKSSLFLVELLESTVTKAQVDMICARLNVKQLTKKVRNLENTIKKYEQRQNVSSSYKKKSSSSKGYSSKRSPCSFSSKRREITKSSSPSSKKDKENEIPSVIDTSDERIVVSPFSSSKKSTRGNKKVPSFIDVVQKSSHEQCSC